MEDHNAGKPHRIVTVLTYLTSIPAGAGGETVFPLCVLPAGGAGGRATRPAPQPPKPFRSAFEAVKLLQDLGHLHTDRAACCKNPSHPEGGARCRAAASIPAHRWKCYARWVSASAPAGGRVPSRRFRPLFCGRRPWDGYHRGGSVRDDLPPPRVKTGSVPHRFSRLDSGIIS